jgi:imidazolonepropionase-like amidohydrolase
MTAPTILANARVFTGTGEPPLESAAVALDGERVTWVGPASEAPAGDVVDCTGKTIVPGLVDAHAHLVYENVRDPYSIELLKPLEEAAIDAVLNAGKLLRMGFTSIGDVGTHGNIAVVVRDAVAAGRLGRPPASTPRSRSSPCGAGWGTFTRRTSSAASSTPRP